MSRALVDHPWVFNVIDDEKSFSQRVELRTPEDLVQLRKDLGIRLLISDQDWDCPDLPMIQVYDDYLE